MEIFMEDPTPFFVPKEEDAEMYKGAKRGVLVRV
jgi:hypothetical protein